MSGLFPLRCVRCIGVVTALPLGSRHDRGRRSAISLSVLEIRPENRGNLTEDRVNQAAREAGNRMRKLSAEPTAAGHATESSTPYAATAIKLMLENNGQ